MSSEMPLHCTWQTNGSRYLSISDPDCLPYLKEFCRDRHIHLVVPLIDPELIPLSQQKDDFAAQGTTVLVCSEETNHISNDKQRTGRIFPQMRRCHAAAVDDR